MGKIWNRWFTHEVPAAEPTAAVATVGAAAAVADPLPAKDIPILDSVEVEDLFYRLVLGMPDSTVVDMRAPEEAMLERLNEVCGADRFDIGCLPRLPAVLPQLLQLLKSEAADGAKVARLIGRDPVLVGEVMRVTKSVHYRTSKPIVSLQHAVVLLGQDGLRKMVAQHVMKPILQGSAGMLGHVAGQRLWSHAERCAHASMFLAKGQSDPFEAYLAGIVCNTGIGALIRVLDQEVWPTVGVFSRSFLSRCAQIGNHLTMRAAQYWELPPNVIDALGERMAARGRPLATVLGKALLAGDHLAMVHVLAENNRIGRSAALAEDRVDGLPALLVDRARQDLRRSFAPDGDSA